MPTVGSEKVHGLHPVVNQDPPLPLELLPVNELPRTPQDVIDSSLPHFLHGNHEFRSLKALPTSTALLTLRQLALTSCQGGPRIMT